MSSQQGQTRGEIVGEAVERPTRAQAQPGLSVMDGNAEPMSDPTNSTVGAAVKETETKKDPNFRRAWLAQIIGLSVATLVPIVAIVSYAAALPIPALQAMGALAVLGLAGFMSGAFMGFLFGIPRSVIASGKDGDMGSGVSVGNLDPVVTQPNTNLEQISDWLTKIVVGATLVQLGPIVSGLGILFSRMGTLIGGGEAASIFIGAVMIYSAIVGFIQGWIAARVWFPWFVEATRTPAWKEKLRRQGE